MTEHDLTTMLRDHLADEPPVLLSSDDAIRTARLQTARSRALALGAGGLAVAAVAALGVSAAGLLDDESAPVPVAQEPPLALTDAMEAAAISGFGPHAGALGDPSWTINTVVGDPVEADDPAAQAFLLDYRPAGTAQVSLTVAGFAESDRERYEFEGACESQLERGVLASCTETTLGDGSLLTVSVGPIAQIGGDAVRMLTVDEVEGRDPSTFAWARVVAVDSAAEVATRASEYVRAADLDSADWQVPVTALESLALDPALLGADVAHAPMPRVTRP